MTMEVAATQVLCSPSKTCSSPEPLRPSAGQQNSQAAGRQHAKPGSSQNVVGVVLAEAAPALQPPQAKACLDAHPEGCEMSTALEAQHQPIACQIDNQRLCSAARVSPAAGASDAARVRPAEAAQDANNHLLWHAADSFEHGHIAPSQLLAATQLLPDFFSDQAQQRNMQINEALRPSTSLPPTYPGPVPIPAPAVESSPAPVMLPASLPHLTCQQSAAEAALHATSAPAAAAAASNGITPLDTAVPAPAAGSSGVAINNQGSGVATDSQGEAAHHQPGTPYEPQATHLAAAPVAARCTTALASTIQAEAAATIEQIAAVSMAATGLAGAGVAETGRGVLPRAGLFDAIKRAQTGADLAEPMQEVAPAGGDTAQHKEQQGHATQQDLVGQLSPRPHQAHVQKMPSTLQKQCTSSPTKRLHGSLDAICTSSDHHAQQVQDRSMAIGNVTGATVMNVPQATAPHLGPALLGQGPMGTEPPSLCQSIVGSCEQVLLPEGAGLPPSLELVHQQPPLQEDMAGTAQVEALGTGAQNAGVLLLAEAKPEALGRAQAASLGVDTTTAQGQDMHKAVRGTCQHAAALAPPLATDASAMEFDTAAVSERQEPVLQPAELASQVPADSTRLDAQPAAAAAAATAAVVLAPASNMNAEGQTVQAAAAGEKEQGLTAVTLLPQLVSMPAPPAVPHDGKATAACVVPQEPQQPQAAAASEPQGPQHPPAGAATDCAVPQETCQLQAGAANHYNSLEPRSLQMEAAADPCKADEAGQLVSFASQSSVRELLNRLNQGFMHGREVESLASAVLMHSARIVVSEGLGISSKHDAAVYNEMLNLVQLLELDARRQHGLMSFSFAHDNCGDGACPIHLTALPHLSQRIEWGSAQAYVASGGGTSPPVSSVLHSSLQNGAQAGVEQQADGSPQGAHSSVDDTLDDVMSDGEVQYYLQKDPKITSRTSYAAYKAYRAAQGKTAHATGASPLPSSLQRSSSTPGSAPRLRRGPSASAAPAPHLKAVDVLQNSTPDARDKMHVTPAIAAAPGMQAAAQRTATSVSPAPKHLQFDHSRSTPEVATQPGTTVATIDAQPAMQAGHAGTAGASGVSTCQDANEHAHATARCSSEQGMVLTLTAAFPSRQLDAPNHSPVSHSKNGSISLAGQQGGTSQATPCLNQSSAELSQQATLPIPAEGSHIPAAAAAAAAEQPVTFAHQLQGCVEQQENERQCKLPEPKASVCQHVAQDSDVVLPLAEQLAKRQQTIAGSTAAPMQHTEAAEAAPAITEAQAAGGRLQGTTLAVAPEKTAVASPGNSLAAVSPGNSPVGTINAVVAPPSSQQWAGGSKQQQPSASIDPSVDVVPATPSSQGYAASASGVSMQQAGRYEQPRSCATSQQQQQQQYSVLPVQGRAAPEASRAGHPCMPPPAVLQVKAGMTLPMAPPKALPRKPAIRQTAVSDVQDNQTAGSAAWQQPTGRAGTPALRSQSNQQLQGMLQYTQTDFEELPVFAHGTSAPAAAVSADDMPTLGGGMAAAAGAVAAARASHGEDVTMGEHDGDGSDGAAGQQEGVGTSNGAAVRARDGSGRGRPVAVRRGSRLSPPSKAAPPRRKSHAQRVAELKAGQRQHAARLATVFAKAPQPVVHALPAVSPHQARLQQTSQTPAKTTTAAERAGHGLVAAQRGNSGKAHTARTPTGAAATPPSRTPASESEQQAGVKQGVRSLTPALLATLLEGIPALASSPAGDPQHPCSPMAKVHQAEAARDSKHTRSPSKTRRPLLPSPNKPSPGKAAARLSVANAGVRKHSNRAATVAAAAAAIATGRVTELVDRERCLSSKPEMLEQPQSAVVTADGAERAVSASEQQGQGITGTSQANDLGGSDPVEVTCPSGAVVLVGGPGFRSKKRLLVPDSQAAAGNEPLQQDSTLLNKGEASKQLQANTMMPPPRVEHQHQALPTSANLAVGLTSPTIQRAVVTPGKRNAAAMCDAMCDTTNGKSPGVNKAGGAGAVAQQQAAGRQQKRQHLTDVTAAQHGQLELRASRTTPKPPGYYARLCESHPRVESQDVYDPAQDPDADVDPRTEHELSSDIQPSEDDSIEGFDAADAAIASAAAKAAGGTLAQPPMGPQLRLQGADSQAVADHGDEEGVESGDGDGRGVQMGEYGPPQAKQKTRRLSDLVQLAAKGRPADSVVVLETAQQQQQQQQQTLQRRNSSIPPEGHAASLQVGRKSSAKVGSHAEDVQAADVTHQQAPQRPGSGGAAAKLGCSRCRFSKSGCTKCRPAGFQSPPATQLRAGVTQHGNGKTPGTPAACNGTTATPSRPPGIGAKTPGVKPTQVPWSSGRSLAGNSVTPSAQGRAAAAGRDEMDGRPSGGALGKRPGRELQDGTATHARTKRARSLGVFWGLKFLLTGLLKPLTRSDAAAASSRDSEGAGVKVDKRAIRDEIAQKIIFGNGTVLEELPPVQVPLHASVATARSSPRKAASRKSLGLDNQMSAELVPQYAGDASEFPDIVITDGDELTCRCLSGIARGAAVLSSSWIADCLYWCKYLEPDTVATGQLLHPPNKALRSEGPFAGVTVLVAGSNKFCTSLGSTLVHAGAQLASQLPNPAAVTRQAPASSPARQPRLHPHVHAVIMEDCWLHMPHEPPLHAVTRQTTGKKRGRQTALMNHVGRKHGRQGADCDGDAGLSSQDAPSPMSGNASGQPEVAARMKSIRDAAQALGIPLHTRSWVQDVLMAGKLPENFFDQQQLQLAPQQQPNHQQNNTQEELAAVLECHMTASAGADEGVMRQQALRAGTDFSFGQLGPADFSQQLQVQATASIQAPRSPHPVRAALSPSRATLQKAAPSTAVIASTTMSPPAKKATLPSPQQQPVAGQQRATPASPLVQQQGQGSKQQQQAALHSPVSSPGGGGGGAGLQHEPLAALRSPSSTSLDTSHRHMLASPSPSPKHPSPNQQAAHQAERTPQKQPRQQAAHQTEKTLQRQPNQQAAEPARAGKAVVGPEARLPPAAPPARPQLAWLQPSMDPPAGFPGHPRRMFYQGFTLNGVEVRLQDCVELDPAPGEKLPRIARIEQCWCELPFDNVPRWLAVVTLYCWPQDTCFPVGPAAPGSPPWLYLTDIQDQRFSLLGLRRKVLVAHDLVAAQPGSNSADQAALPDFVCLHKYNHKTMMPELLPPAPAGPSC